METRKFKPADLKESRFFFTFSPGQWDGGYRHPCVYVWILNPRWRTYHSVMSFTSQMSKTRESLDRQSVFAYALEAQIRLGYDTCDPIVGKILARFYDTYGHDFKRLMRAFKALKIPRYVRHQPDRNLSENYVPRPFKDRAETYIQARSLVAVEAQS